MIKKLHIGWLLLFSLALSVLIIAGVFLKIFPDGSVSGQDSTQKIIGKSPSSEIYQDTGFIGPEINIPNGKENEYPPESIELTPVFDSIRPFPGSLLPFHIDSMWFFVSDSDFSGTLDSIYLIVKGKELALLTIEDDFGFFNYVRKRPDHNVGFQDLTLNGYKDIKITHWASGATGNTQFSIFLYCEEDTTYRYNAEFSRFTNIRVDEEGFYHTSSKGGWGNYRGKIMVLNKMEDESKFKTIVSYDQDWSPYPHFSDFYQIMKFHFDTLYISYVDTIPNHLRPVAFNDFQNVFNMNSRVKYYNPEIHCTPNREDDHFPDCTFTFRSRLMDHEIRIFSDLKNRRLEISDDGSFDPVVLDIEINKNDKDFELNSSYLRAALSFYKNWRSKPGLYLFIRSVNIELIDPGNDNKYDCNIPLQLL